MTETDKCIQRILNNAKKQEWPEDELIWALKEVIVGELDEVCARIESMEGIISPKYTEIRTMVEKRIEAL